MAVTVGDLFAKALGFGVGGVLIVAGMTFWVTFAYERARLGRSPHIAKSSRPPQAACSGRVGGVITDHEIRRTLGDIYRRLGCIDRKIDLVIRAQGIDTKHLEEQMNEAAQALEAEIAKVETDEQGQTAAIVAGGEAIAGASAKFGELKTEIEGLQAGSTLSQEQIESLTAKATETDTQITEGATQLTTHVAQLNEAAAAA